MHYFIISYAVCPGILIKKKVPNIDRMMYFEFILRLCLINALDLIKISKQTVWHERAYNNVYGHQMTRVKKEHGVGVSMFFV